MRRGKNIAHIYPLIGPVKAQVDAPGSKSFTNRALIIASLARGMSVLSGYSDANDSLLLIKILQQLGVEILLDGNIITVKGNGGKFKKFNGKINVEDAGTVMRFLTALCCFVPGEIILEGAPRMHRRPVKGLTDALIQLGAKITYMGEIGFPPVKINGGKLYGGKVSIDASSSSQFISALLMIAPLLDTDLEIIANRKIASAPYVDMTISVMKNFGAGVNKQSENKYFIKKKPTYKPAEYAIEGDASCASYLFALAAITQSTIRVNNLSPSGLQGDIKFTELLGQMGCKIVKGKNYIEVTGGKDLKGINADMKNMQDVAPTLAVVAAFAKGVTVLKGLRNLEIKETNRLTAIQAELNKMDIKCNTDGEQIVIRGGNPKGALINTYNDHRMAMAFAIAGTKAEGISIKSPGIIKKSFPVFWDVLKKIGVKINIEKTSGNIVLIGFMGAGKTTVGRLLAQELQLQLVETDDEIVKRSGLKSINEIFGKKGESFFRKTEKEVIADFTLTSGCIISCGGGVITSPENMEVLKEYGNIIFLSATYETIIGRLKNQNARPLFKDNHKAKQLYHERLPLYRKYADKVIFTDRLTPEEVTEAIVSKLLVPHA